MFCGVSLALIVAIVGLALVFLKYRYNYWARRGVVHDKPTWLKGNIGTVGKTTTICEPIRDFYNKYKNKSPFGGFYFPLRHVALLLDLELVKQVLIKDFGNFAHRGNYYNEVDDPISAHLFNLDGPGWKEMRTKLTPTFTSLKMHQMLPTVVEIGERFVAVIQRDVDASLAISAPETPIEMKDLLARFTTDVIGSCAFGLDCNSLANPNVEFRVFGRRVFTERRHGRLAFAFLQSFPKLARHLHIKLARDDVSDFYMRVVRETLEYRDQHKVQRNDFLNLLMELRKESGGGLTFNQIAAQAFVFFLAGFETSSSTMGFALYLLAMHPETQKRAREEVQRVWAKYGEFSYEAYKEFKYIQQVIYETMRMYSIAPILARKAINDYEVSGTSHIIEAGTTVIIPVDAIHYDPDIYPEPERFDPDRFAPEAVEQRHPMSWLPFGAGPRNCIGLRFGEMQSVIGLAMLLKHFQFSAAKETPIPLEIDKESFILASKGGIVLNVQSL
ncbi:cytochrome P450 6a2-like [Scaptodrosophila lebanonensis]|uniref:Cytochrome P450 6a2-like n=1 Tax=Drosophila lebanonensis TaxID=7225 RepID=A0A6J2TK86_DROLE|nr:cytochrome P450 6a2-like [Scaptodrosophila lebanonensis]